MGGMLQLHSRALQMERPTPNPSEMGALRLEVSDASEESVKLTFQNRVLWAAVTSIASVISPKARSAGLPFVVTLWMTLQSIICPSTMAADARAQGLGGAQIVDTLTLGNAASEQAHALQADHSEIVAHAALGNSARRLLPLSDGNWEGGTIDFMMKVDSEKQNYFTAKFWGSEPNPNRLILFIEGRQVGYRHLGDVDILDFGSDSDSGGYNGRFYYNTSPLPLAVTTGKTILHCEIRSTGRVWGYASTFEQYQKPMTGPSREIYALYTHTSGCFVPPASERQGDLPIKAPVRPAPGPEVLDALQERVEREIAGELASKRPLGQVQMHFLAEAYFARWSQAHDNPKVVQAIVRGCDAICMAYEDNPKLAQADPAVYNGGWFGFGMMGDAVRLLARPMGPMLDEPIERSSTGEIRRAGWSKMLQASRDWHRAHRRMYTNQSMITDLNIYRDNRGIEAIDSEHALPEAKVLSYLYQSIGIQPWLGSDADNGPEKPMGDHYFELTDKGLSRELGYVGYYGEVVDWVTQIYDATRDPGQEGDPKIKAQLVKIANARAYFRYPMLDAQGYRAMRIETIVGWRDMHYPGDVCYAERPTWDASSIYAPAATLDPQLTGDAQEMFADNQFFASVQGRMEDKGLRVTAGLLAEPEDYQQVKAQPPSQRRLPMSSGQPDFVFADEQDGVLAVKNGDEIFYASLYWRARAAVNFLARVHYITPHYDRIATVAEEASLTPSGKFYTRPDWVNFGFGNGGPKYPGDMHSALAGQKLPIAQLPPDDTNKPGSEDPNAGKADFYTLAYGPYLIGMNTTQQKTFSITTESTAGATINLSDRKPVAPGQTLRVGPRSTVVLFTKMN
jgi:hypothetical protein